MKVKLLNKNIKTISEIFITAMRFERTPAYLLNTCSTVLSRILKTYLYGAIDCVYLICL